MSKKRDSDIKALWEDFFKAMLKDQAKALPILQKLQQMDAENPQVHLKLGDMLVKKGDVPGALEAYHKSAGLLVAEGAKQKALAVLKLLLRLAPQDAKGRELYERILNELEPQSQAPAQSNADDAAGEAGAVQHETPTGEGAIVFDEEAAMPDEQFTSSIEVGNAGWDEAGQEAEPAPAEEPHGSKVPEIFSSLSPGEFEELSASASHRSFNASDAVFREGEQGESMFVIKSGKAIVTVDLRNSTVVIAMLSEGDFFGEMALLSKRPRTATITAFSPLELMEIKKSTLKQFIDKHPKILKSLVNFYYSRVSLSRRILKSGGGKTAPSS